MSSDGYGNTDKSSDELKDKLLRHQAMHEHIREGPMNSSKHDSTNYINVIVYGLIAVASAYIIFMIVKTVRDNRLKGELS